MDCNECTLCCDLFHVKWLNKTAIEKCKYCDEGCTIHETKPAECTDFECAYYQMKNVSADLRPDRCHVVFEKIGDSLFWGTKDPTNDISEIGMKQIESFVRQGFSVMIGTDGEKPKIYLADGHSSEMIKKEIDKFLQVD